jgi:protein-tyrosine phosphatase
MAGERIARTFLPFAEPDRYPILVHCTAGKDRTGVLIGLLMDLLGCSVPDMAREYQLSEAATDRLIAYLRASGRQLEGTDAEIRQRLSSPGARMAGFIELMRERYGGAEAFFLSQGIAPATIASVRDLLTIPV